jgi:DNA-binding NarL/FixJ family response regulator
MNPITVLLADDHMLVRQGLRALLALDSGIQVVAEASDGREAVTLTKKHQPDVLVMDIAMPQLNGIGATRQIVAESPATKIIILSAHSDDPYIQRVLEAGAVGFLIKQSSAQCLSTAIREVMNGKKFFSPSIAKRILEQKPTPEKLRGAKSATGLTPRELEVLQLVAEGAPNKQVAAKLGISIKTVEKHRQHLMDKLNIHDTAGLTRYAIARGIIESCVQVTIV